MIEINISSLKNQLSAVLKKVRKGEEVLVMNRDQPVARLSAVGHPVTGREDTSLLHELEKRGVVQPASGPLPSRDWLESHLVRPKKGGSAVRALLEEREESR